MKTYVRVFCVLLCLISSKSFADKEKVLSEIEIRSKHFGALPFAPYSVKQLLTFDQMTFVVLKDKDTLEHINDKVLKTTIKEIVAEDYPDFRIVCLLKYSKSKEVDTLGFGVGPGIPPPLMEFNGKQYELDIELLKLIAGSLPESHKKGVYDYINRYIPSLYQPQTED